jgi:hypothetical protein
MRHRLGTYLRNNVLGLIAIFIALGAGAYASGLAKNSVKSKQIKAGAVKNTELADDAVTAPKVADGSLRSEDFAPGQLPAGPQGTQGPQGPAGSAAPADGPTVMMGRIQSSGSSCLIGAPTGLSVSAPCDGTGPSSRSGIVPTDKIARNIRFSLNSPVVGGQKTAFLLSDMGSSAQTIAFCTMQPGETACSVPGPAPVPAGSRLFVQLDANLPTLAFGYELWSPSAG